MKLLQLLLLPLLLLLIAFTTTTTTTTTTGCTLNLDTIYNSTGVASTGITQLGIQLFQELGAQKNIFISPYSIWSLLALLLAGAEGHTEEELRLMLGVTGKDGLLSLLGKLGGSLEGAAVSDNKVSLDIANRIYVQTGFSIKKCQNELSNLLVQLDFKKNIEASNTINDFVNTSTRGLIPDIVSPDMLNQNTLMVALNAIYFKGSWTTPFPKENTKPLPFYVSPESEPVNVDTMFMLDMPVMLGYSQALGATVLRLNYSTGHFSMTVLLPDDHGEAALNATISALNPTTLWQAITDVQPTEYDVYMPKFKIESKFQDELKAVLQKMGLNDLFTRMADLSSFGDNLYVEHIIHKAFVKVDEEGTEAAAVTGAVVALFSLQVREIRLDRPFVFFIHDKDNILFIGAFRKP